MLKDADGALRDEVHLPAEDTNPAAQDFIAPASNPYINVKFANAAAGVLVFTVVVILWGAFVRASLSGDGCGNSWPLCGGSNSIIPDLSQQKTVVEFSHRISGALLFLPIIGLYVASLLAFPKGSPVRRATAWSVGLTIFEGLIGAVLVKFGWVTVDKSMARAVTMPFHLMSTYALTGSLTLAWHYARGGERLRWRGQGGVGTALKAMVAGLAVLGMTGAISALGKTAFALELASAKSVAERWAQHLGENAPAILRGGVLHPLVATSVGVVVLWLSGYVTDRRPVPGVQKWSKWTVGLYIGQFVFGIVNLIVSAPVWMQLVHLALAVASWVALVLLCANALGVSWSAADETQEAKTEPKTFAETVKAYVALTKPRVISLLLFTTYAAMIIAKGGWPDWRLALAVMVGGYMSAGAANTFNMVIERDLDVAMERTSHRPTVTKTVSKSEALWFAYAMAAGSFALLSWSANVLAATMALCGLLTYVFVYTLWLKRRTWQNIVIGGAAGAFPPLVGYAAQAGHLNAFAWFLFAIIFAWTPVHFWALAILIKDDYAKAGVPMLPVVKGDKVTVTQIVLYAVITALVCAMPLFEKSVGMVYFLGSGLLNIALVSHSLRLFRTPDKIHARRLFKFSMAYLALIFIVIAVDRAVMA
ncbi:MAG: protoheme IX farnesyltransferase [Armatimonadetes bacterium]|nr:protoheme IX farnesyltransferase [Armatimonadota bacterium]